MLTSNVCFPGVSSVVIGWESGGDVKVASLLEPEVLQSYIDAFGFGELTGIDLPGEVPGFTRPPRTTSS